MAEVKRKKNESFESLLRRFNRRVTQSGRIIQAKKLRFHSREKSKNVQRFSALRRLQVAAKRDYLLKTGQLVEEERRPRR